MKCHWADSAMGRKDDGKMSAKRRMSKCYTALLPSYARIPLQPRVGSVKGRGSCAVGLILTTGQVWD